LPVLLCFATPGDIPNQQNLSNRFVARRAEKAATVSEKCGANVRTTEDRCPASAECKRACADRFEPHALPDAGGNRAATTIVLCIDNLLQTDVLVESGEYEVRAECDDCYILSGFDKAFSRKRFEVVPRPTIEFSGRVAAA
jgi:hypothetical protein